MIIGAHNSIAGGLWNAVDEAVEVGGDTMQIFCKNQRQWNAPELAPEDAIRFKDAVAAARLQRIMVHDSYLINMGNPDPEKAANATAAFERELVRCEQLDIAYLNFHPGSHMVTGKKNRDDPDIRRDCLDRIAANMAAAHEAVPGNTKLVIENAAGQGTNVGSTWEEVGHLADAAEAAGVPKDRLGICVDTQHTWAAGYDWVDAYDEVWDSFEEHVGFDRLVAFHLNDSKQPCGARVDRHDNIGVGHLGDGFWRRLMQDDRFDGTCGYLETPRPEESVQIWADEIAFLRSLQEP